MDMLQVVVYIDVPLSDRSSMLELARSVPYTAQFQNALLSSSIEECIVPAAVVVVKEDAPPAVLGEHEHGVNVYCMISHGMPCTEGAAVVVVQTEDDNLLYIIAGAGMPRRSYMSCVAGVLLNTIAWSGGGGLLVVIIICICVCRCRAKNAKKSELLFPL